MLFTFQAPDSTHSHSLYYIMTHSQVQLSLLSQLLPLSFLTPTLISPRQGLTNRSGWHKAVILSPLLNECWGYKHVTHAHPPFLPSHSLSQVFPISQLDYVSSGVHKTWRILRGGVFKNRHILNWLEWCHGY